MLSYNVSSLKLAGTLLGSSGSVDFIAPTATTATWDCHQGTPSYVLPLHSVTSTKKAHSGYFKVDNTKNC